MVAGRRFWSEDEQYSAHHQADGRGDLDIEGVVEDGPGAGEAGRLDADVGARGQVDEEDDGEAEQAEGEDDPPQAAAPLVAQCRDGEESGEQRHGDQQVGVGFARRLRPDGRRVGCRQARVARLADLDGPVGDELGGEQEARRDEDRQADRAL